MRMREKENNKDTNENIDTTEEVETLSSQEMINDARERRHQNVKTIQCEQCDFKSASKTLLMRHQHSVHEGNSYTCEQCEYKATTKENLEKHIRIHQRYQCEQCDYKDETEGGSKIYFWSWAYLEQSDQRKKNLSYAQKLFSLTIFAFLRCFKVLYKIRGLGNLYLT